MTRRITDYIIKQNLDITYISNLTGIPIHKFKNPDKTPFNASELCRICEFLKINPEQFYTKKIKIM